MQTGYVGTITQSSGISVLVGASGWTQNAGTFLGSNTNITINDRLTLNGGAFTSTSAILELSKISNTGFVILKQAAGSTFAHNNGTVKLTTSEGACAMPTFTIEPDTNIVFFNVEISGQNTGCGSGITKTAVASGKTATVLNDLLHTSGNIGGAWELKRNLVVGALATSDRVNPSSVIRFSGTGAQTYAYTAGGRTAEIEVNKTAGGAVTAAGGTTALTTQKLKLTQGDFTAPTGTLSIGSTNSSGSFDIFDQASGTIFSHNSGTVRFDGFASNCGGIYENIKAPAGVLTLNNVVVLGENMGCGGGWTQFTMTAGVSVLVLGDMSFNGGLLGGTWDVRGNYSTTTASTMGGTAAITLSGATNRTLIASLGDAPAAPFTIDKSSLTVTETATGNLNFRNAGASLNINTGTLDLAGSNLTVNSALTIGANAKLICNGGSVTAGSYVLNGEISCGTSIGITWTGATGDGLWTTAGNWTNNTVPTLNDVAIFNARCAGANCNVNINAAVDVKGMNITSVYTGTITQAAGNSIYVRSSGWIQAAGTFAGGNSAITLAGGGAFTLTAGTFTSTSGTFSIIDGNFTVSGAPVFGVNSGTVTFTRTGGGTNTIRANGIAFNNVNVIGFGAVHNLNAETLIVNGLLTVGDTDGTGAIDNGNISARGDVTFVNIGKGGTATIKIAGTTNQTITGIVAGRIPNFEVVSTGGTVSFVGTLLFLETNYTYTSGTVNAGTSTLLFTSSNGANKTLIPGTVAYNNVTFQGNVLTTDLAGGNMTVTGLLTLDASAGGGINNGTITARGDVTALRQGKGGTATVKTAGTGNQLVTGVVGASFPSLEIASTGGIVTFSGNLRLTQNYTHTSGTVDSGTSTLTIYNNVGSTTITPGPVAYNNVTFAGFASTFSLASGTMTVNGTLTLADSWSSNQPINSGTLLAKGPVVFQDQGYSGTALVKIAGATNQSISGTSNAGVPPLEIASTGGTVTFLGTLYLKNNYTYTSGTVDAGTSTLKIYNNVASTTITPGAIAYNNVTFEGFAATFSLASGTMTTNGTLTLGDTWGSNALNSGTLQANGNVVFNNYGYAGTAVLNMLGSTSTTLSSVSSATTTTPSILINKSGGATVTMSSNVNFSTTSQSLSLTGGTLDLGGWDLGVNSVLTVGGGTTLKCSGGVFTVGSLSNSGTINCPGYAAYDFNWTGAGGNSNWNTAGNWQNGIVPGAADVASFESTYCGANCNATVNVNPSVKGVKIYSTYTHTITQAAGIAMNIGSRGWIQAGGTFTGGNSTITYSGNFDLSGGTFSAPANTIYPLTNFIVTGSPTFNAGTSTLEFTEGGIITPGTVTYNNVTFPYGTNWNVYNLSGGDMKVGGTLTSSFGAWNSEARTINNGSISAYGNVNISSYGIVGTSTIVMAGNASGQTLAVTGSVAQLPSFAIAAGANPVTITGLLNIRGNYTFTSVGTLTSAGSTMNFVGNGGTITPGTITYGNNVRFGYAENYGVFSLAGGNFKVGGTLELSAGGWTGDPKTINNGTISAYGDVNVSVRGANGSATLVIAGNPSGQTLSSTGASAITPNLEIAAGTNPVTLSGMIYLNSNFTMTSVGTLTTTGSTLNFNGIGGTITPGAATYNNVTFGEAENYGVYSLAGGNLRVGGNLGLSYGAWSGGQRTINNGNIFAYGGVNVSSFGSDGTAVVSLKGNASGQLITFTGSNARIPNLNFDIGANTTSISGTVRVLNATTVTSGSPSMAGGNLNTLSLALAGNTLTKSGGVLTVNNVVQGTGSLFGGTVNP